METNIDKVRQIVKKMYSDENDLRTSDGKKIEVPVEGSLGLLALGYRGVIAVKKKRRNILKEQKTK